MGVKFGSYGVIITPTSVYQWIKKYTWMIKNMLNLIIQKYVPMYGTIDIIIQNIAGSNNLELYTSYLTV